MIVILADGKFFLEWLNTEAQIVKGYLNILLKQYIIE